VPRREIDPGRRRRLVHVVVTVVAACGVILVAAAISRMVRRDDGASASVGPRIALASRAGEDADPSSARANTIAGVPAVGDTPATGSVRIAPPAAPGHVWLDGKRLTATSSLVSCGKHQLRLGARDRGRTVDVPCGGEVRVSY
jgi:hypothetical protein